MSLRPWRYQLAVYLALSLLCTAQGQEQPAASTEASPAGYSTKLVIPLRAPDRPSGIKPMTLSEALSLGQAQNPQVRVAAEAVEQARAVYEQQRSQKRPKLLLDNTTTLQRERSINTNGLFKNVNRPPNFPDRFVLNSPVTDNFQLSLQMLLTTFGKIENEIAASFLQIDVERAQLDVERLNLSYQVKQAFFEKLNADAQVGVSRLNLSVANQNLDDTQALFEQGVMSRYDILQAQIQVTRGVEDLAQNLTDVDTATANIGNVLAERKFYVQPMEPPPLLVQPEIELPTLEHFALNNRPEMLSLEYNRAVAEKLLDAAKSENNPTVVLAANYQTAFGQSLSPLDVASLTLTIQWQIFDGGYRKARVAEAESVLRQIDAQGEQLQNNILLDVAQRWLDLQQTAFNLVTTEQLVANAVEYYDMARRRYINGLATTLEVSDSLRNLIAARSRLEETRLNRDLAFAKLEQALGQDVPDRRLTLEFLQGGDEPTPVPAADPAKESNP